MGNGDGEGDLVDEEVEVAGDVELVLPTLPHEVVVEHLVALCADPAHQPGPAQLQWLLIPKFWLTLPSAPSPPEL